jgi:hypothetical protein
MEKLFPFSSNRVTEVTASVTLHNPTVLLTMPDPFLSLFNSHNAVLYVDPAYLKMFAMPRNGKVVEVEPAPPNAIPNARFICLEDEAEDPFPSNVVNE